jgi:K+-transporting ATPase A subunit
MIRVLVSAGVQLILTLTHTMVAGNYLQSVLLANTTLVKKCAKSVVMKMLSCVQISREQVSSAMIILLRLLTEFANALNLSFLLKARVKIKLNVQKVCTTMLSTTCAWIALKTAKSVETNQENV